MKKQAIHFVLAVAVFAVASSSAIASISVETDLLTGNSFGYGFKQQNNNPFDHVQIILKSSHQNDFENIIPFTSGWSQTSHGNNLVIANGFSTNSFNFQLWFTGNPTDDVKFSCQTFQGNNCIENIDCTFHGNDCTWEFKNNSDLNCGKIEGSVPEPATAVIWSLLCGLGLIFAWRKRKAA